MENKYTFKLTLDEMKMIRNALEYEAERRSNIHSTKVEEHNALADLFSIRIYDAYKQRRGEVK